MPATIRIDFDVNAGSISEALKKELEKVQGVMSSVNSSVEKSRNDSNIKVANEAIKQEQRVATEASAQKEKQSKYLLDLHKRSIADAEKAENAATKAAEKEREKTEKYLLGVRMASIKAANAAELKAEKELEAARKKAEEQTTQKKEHKHEVFKEVLGAGAALEGLNVLIEKSKEATEYGVKMQTAFGSGTGLKAAKEDAKKLGEQFGLTEMQAGDILAQNKAAMKSTGASQEEIIKLTQARIAMEAAGLPVSAKQLATEKGRQHILEVGGGLVANAMKAAQDPAKQAQLAMAQVQETLGEVAKIVLDSLGPALKAVTPILSELGGLIGTIIKPLFDALSPIIELIGKTFAELTPIITELIGDAMEVLIPIIGIISDALKEFLPPIMDVVKAIMGALKPVFEAVKPIFLEVATIVKEVLMANMGMFIDVLQNVLVPIIRDLVAPILLSMMPLFKMLADMMQDFVVPATKILSGVMQFLMNNIVQPLIKWLSGGLVDAINAVVEVVTAAIKVVNGVVNAFKSLLGMGDDAAVAATKKTVQAVNQVQAQGQAESEQQFDDHAKKKEKKVKDHSDAVRKSYIQQQQDLIDLDEQTYAEAITKLEKYYDTLKETNIKGRKEVSNAIEKYKTAEFETAKKAEDQQLKIKELALVREGMNDEDFKEAREALEIEHLSKMLEIAESSGQDTIDAQLALQNAQIAQQKRINKEKIDNDNSLRDMLLQNGVILSQEAEKERKKTEQDLVELKNARMSAVNFMMSGEQQMTDFFSKNKKDQLGIAKNYLAQEVKQFIASKLAELVVTQSTETGKTTVTLAGIASRAVAMAEELAGTIANAATDAFGAVMAGIRSVMGLPFPLNAIVAAGIPASVFGLYEGAKAMFGKKEGGFTGYGNPNDPSGHYTHKNEFVLKSGSFAVDSSGNLVSVAGMGGGQGHVVAAIDRQTETLGREMSKSTVLNQDRMVVENYRVERSRSRSAA